MADYAAKPTKAKEDAGIIDLRKRMLGVFLNRCRRMKEVREDGVWWRFLDPNASWVRQPQDRVIHLNDIACSERSTAFGSSGNDTETYYESTSARCRESYTRASMAPCSSILRQVKGSNEDLLNWYPLITS